MKIDQGINGGSKSAKKGLKLVGDSKRAEMMAKCKQHQIVQLKLYIDRAKFIKDQAILMVRELEKSVDYDLCSVLGIVFFFLLTWYLF
jgi:hypothetical protein